MQVWKQGLRNRRKSALRKQAQKTSDTIPDLEEGSFRIPESVLRRLDTDITLTRHEQTLQQQFNDALDLQQIVTVSQRNIGNPNLLYIDGPVHGSWEFPYIGNPGFYLQTENKNACVLLLSYTALLYACR